MIKETIKIDVMNNTVTTERIEDDLPEYIDYPPEIDACKARLAATDYVVIKIAEGAAEREEYADVIAERAALIARIHELERFAAEQAVAHGE